MLTLIVRIIYLFFVDFSHNMEVVVLVSNLHQSGNKMRNQTFVQIVPQILHFLKENIIVDLVVVLCVMIVQVKGELCVFQKKMIVFGCLYHEIYYLYTCQSDIYSLSHWILLFLTYIHSLIGILSYFYFFWKTHVSENVV